MMFEEWQKADAESAHKRAYDAGCAASTESACKARNGIYHDVYCELLHIFQALKGSNCPDEVVAMTKTMLDRYNSLRRGL